MEVFVINRGTTFSWNLTFPTDVQGQTLLFTAASVIDSDDSDATIKKTYSIPAGPEVLTYTATLTPTDTTVAEGLYFCNFRLVGGASSIGDSETFQVSIQQGPTTRTS